MTHLCARCRKPPPGLAEPKSIGSLTSSTASSHHLFPFGPSSSSTLFQQAAPHPFFQESYLSPTTRLYILEFAQQSSSSRNRALFTALISPVLIVSQSPFVTESPPNLTQLRLCGTTHHRRPYLYLNTHHHTRVLNGQAPVSRLSNPLVFHLPLATILSNTAETST